GLAFGAVHPLGLLLSLFVAGPLPVSGAAPGIHSSLNAQSSSRAITKTLLTLVVLHGGYLVLPLPRLGAPRYSVRSDYLWMGCTPVLAALALVSYDEAATLGEILRGTKPVGLGYGRYLIVAWLILSACMLTAAALLRRAVMRFDEVVDRPR